MKIFSLTLNRQSVVNALLGDNVEQALFQFAGRFFREILPDRVDLIALVPSVEKKNFQI